MILRIILGVACLSLLNASQAEAQLFRRFRAQPQPQPRYQPQPQRYAPRTVAPQNGYQGRLTASQRSRPVYVRRADGSVVAYYPNIAQQPTQVQRQLVQRPQAPTQVQPNGRPRPNIAAVQGRLVPVRPTAQVPRPSNNVYLRPTVQPPAVAPVGVSVLNQPQTQLQAQAQPQTGAQKVADSITPATKMPEAAVTLGEPASSIPVNTAATNPAPKGLSLSLDDEDIVPASANVDVEPTPAADVVLDSNGKETFSVLETID